MVGAGAGSDNCCILKRAGHNVELVCKYDEHASLASGTGIKVGGVSVVFTQVVPSVAAIETIRGKVDYFLLAVKANDMVDAAERIRSMLDEKFAGGFNAKWDM
ncbi:MAG: 2-dehydropantoate 2-reductase N-terminal domain-containing protein [Bacteroidales bacterium]